MNDATIHEAPQPKALCVDLDGTLIRTDLLHEALLILLRTSPFLIFALPFWMLKGKAAFKRNVFSRIEIDVTHLPYDQRVIDLVDQALAANRTIALCSASDERVVQRVAQHVGRFHVVAGSDGSVNRSGRSKAEFLVSLYGEKGFDYAGNAKVDVRVWKHANAAIVVGSDKLARLAGAVSRLDAHLPSQSGGIRAWARALRLHQWLKNLLIFIPVLAAHRILEPATVMSAGLAFLAFSLCASGVYLVNDLFDLDADRKHPRKKNRPFAAGTIPVQHGAIVAPILTVLAFLLATQISSRFALILGAYWVVTFAYSFMLKQAVMLDVIILAGLYTVRIIGGAAAIKAPLSFWLLAFSMFIFLSLALLKRCTELYSAQKSGKAKASGRGYVVQDLQLLQSMGTSSGYLSVMVLALYINSPESLTLYGEPRFLWLLCPLMLYWISRTWMLAHRGQMHDDPVVFAAKDWFSRATVVAFICIVAAAI